ncbi:hypothetical protein DL240_05775 [Lujinxingia litoralis]|uniref:CREG-like beta-barrel domain-containing protein n=1 Tax=Lujinxingia litoralis TaxID=2211119 RepID=A0A328C9Q0_9DELT|nr:pyridoxamine 5'-phosphate oxidase family protein [Lujinxingia litoralis]RAL23668.1 hypothetical protein DL240_05775 [Lujinxingia litoralis]
MVECEKESGELEELRSEARALLKEARTGVLATLGRAEGTPYASVVDVAGAPKGGDLLLLLSDLAEHTRNLRVDARASVVVADAQGEGEVLERGRASFQGRVESVRGEALEALREHYLRCHPQARGYVGFADFNLYVLRVDRVRFVAGFGRMGWIEGEVWHALTED